MALRFGLITVSFLLVFTAIYVPGLSASPIDDLKQQIVARDAQVKELEAKVKETKAQLAEIRSKERTLENEIASLDRQIESLELEIRITEGRIDAARLHIEELRLEIAQKETEIDIGEARLAEILRAMQLAEDGLGAVELVFAARPFSEVFDALRSAELFDQSLALTLQEIKRSKEELEQAKTKTEEEKLQAEKLRDELRIKRLLLTGQQDEREDLLNLTEREETNYQKLLKDTEAQQRAIQRDILTLEAQLRYLIDPSSLPGKGVLSWPVLSVRITQGYGATSSTGFTNDQYDFHNGIDLGAATQGIIGDPILAAGPGNVVGVGSTGRYAYGRWIAIDHENGLTTLYAHLSYQGVSVGQSVKRGEAIGRMGNTGFSTGPHLHFTVYASETFRVEPRSYGILPLGGSINPLNFLD